MEVKTPSIKNIKLSFKVENLKTNLPSLLPQVKVKKYHNFIVFKLKNYTYIVFPSANFINVTGIRGICCIQQAISYFLTLINSNSQNIDFQIDNITCSGFISKFSNLDHLYKYLRQLENLHSVRFNSYNFHALYLKLQEKGTCIFFNSGKFNIVGITCLDQIEDIFTRLCVLITGK